MGITALISMVAKNIGNSRMILAVLSEFSTATKNIRASSSRLQVSHSHLMDILSVARPRRKFQLKEIPS